MVRGLAKRQQLSHDSESFANAAEELQELSLKVLQPLEEISSFRDVQMMPELKHSQSLPMVLLLGQYSTGKTTLINHILGREYPGFSIGQEPTTEKFVAVVHGTEDCIIPGEAAITDSSLPFDSLNKFGSKFLNRFECAASNVPVLKSMILVDSPGVLAGGKDRTNRGYDFIKVTKWFADRADLILLLFDVSKLDISDELSRVIEAVGNNQRNFRLILNKADTLTTEEFIRVRSALMWNLRSVLPFPEQPRCYAGSFWDSQHHTTHLQEVFEKDETALFQDLAQVPRNATIGKLNEFIQRTNRVKAHCLLMTKLRMDKPWVGWWDHLWGTSDTRKRELLANLDDLCRSASNEAGMAVEDFPSVDQLKDKLLKMQFTDFPSTKDVEHLLDRWSKMMNDIVPKLRKRILYERTRIQPAELGDHLRARL